MKKLIELKMSILLHIIYGSQGDRTDFKMNKDFPLFYFNIDVDFTKKISETNDKLEIEELLGELLYKYETQILYHLLDNNIIKINI